MTQNPDLPIEPLWRIVSVPAPNQHSAKTVLVVDDEWGMADLLAELLLEEGYTSRAVYDGLEALYAVERERPDLAIVDLRIPLHDGVKVAHWLKDQGIPVIMMSALDRPRRLRDDIPFVPKPIDVSGLFAMVAEHLGLDHA